MQQSPIPNPSDDEKAYARTVGLAILGFGLLVCLGGSALGFLRYQAQFVALYGSYFPTPTGTSTPALTLTATPTSTPTNTFTPTPNLTATEAAVRTKNTALAIQSTVTYVADQWQHIFSESFDNNKHGWPIHAEDDKYSKTTSEIKDGKYRLNALSHQGFIKWIPISINDLGDFSLTIEAGVVQYPSSSDYGIVFRWDHKRNMYYFSIDSESTYALYKLQDGEWSTLIDRTETTLIKKDEQNRLSVVAQGDTFILFINDQFVADKQDESIKKGKTAFAYEIFQPDENVTFEFDNIVLRTP